MLMSDMFITPERPKILLKQVRLHILIIFLVKVGC